MPSSLNAALEKVQKKACRLLLEEMLADLQVETWHIQWHIESWVCGKVYIWGKKLSGFYPVLHQPLLMQLPSRQWLAEPYLMNSICEEIAKHGKSFDRARKPISTVRPSHGWTVIEGAL